jgi:hypothetical protein
MSRFVEGPDAAAMAAAFPEAVDVRLSAELIAGIRPLSPDQQDFLLSCCGSGFNLNSNPQTGHLAVRLLGTRGRGNGAVAAILIPGTDECRRRANALRRARWAEWACRALSISCSMAERLWNEAHGHKPTLDALAEVWPFRGFSDRALREAGWRPCHPVEGRAIDIARAIPPRA